jgi:general secretion pathway protein G
MMFPSKARLQSLRRPEFRHRGFTLIEMVIVIGMIMVLLSIALPMYSRSITRSREAKLKQNLAVFSQVIEAYSLDKKQSPQTIGDLVTAGYLKVIPDDITGSPETWKTEPEDSENAWDPNQPGIGRIYSGSDDLSSDGSAYSSWR